MYTEEDENDEQGVYGDEGRESLMKDDEISPEEEAFMSGYDAVEEKKKVDDEEDPYEKAFDEATAGDRGKGRKAKAVHAKPAKKPVAKAAPRKPAAKAKHKPAARRAKPVRKAAKPAKKAKPKHAAKKPAKKKSFLRRLFKRR